MTDCKSLYDALHKEGGLRVPSEKRLIIDLAAIKQILETFEDAQDICQSMTAPMRWVPTELQLADEMTKICTTQLVRAVMESGMLQLPLVDSRQRWLELQQNQRKVQPV